MGAGTATKQKESQNKSNQNQSNQIKKAVKKKLGLTAGGGLGGNNQGFIAANLKGKDKLMYGEEASKMTNDEMLKKNLVKEGNYFKQVGGNFVRISKKEGQKLYAAGDPSISMSTFGNTTSNKIKYGSSNSAMGSGDPTGVMTSIPISSKMLQQQNKIKGISTAVLSLVAPAPVSAVMRASATKNLVNASQPGLAYNDYSQGFQAKQQGKKFTQTRNELGILKLGLSKGKDKLGEIIGN